MADEIIKSDANRVNVAAGVTNDTKQDIVQLRVDPYSKKLLVETPVMDGNGTDETFTITNANTAYAVPTTPPSQNYALIIYNASNSDIYFRFTPGTTAGIKLTSGSIFSVDLGGNQQIYIYSPLAGQIINLSYKII
jgi:hypothetical protein